MSLARGRYGIEFDPKRQGKEPSGLGGVFVLVALAAGVSLTWTIVNRFRSSAEETALTERVAEAAPPAAEAPPAQPEERAEPTEAPPPVPVAATDSYVRRPAKVRNLLMRLEEAEKRRDVEMAVTTIESIRALPGSPAADIDDALARRLGSLNLRRLFVIRNRQWVKAVTVKRGDSASRIAAENGSTLASFARLNGGNVNQIKIGATVYVMNHPRFNLVLRRRARIADLSLNGKFFRRYDLRGEVKDKEGAYELTEKRRAFWSTVGASFGSADREELEMLLPNGTPVLVSTL